MWADDIIYLVKHTIAVSPIIIIPKKEGHNQTTYIYLLMAFLGIDLIMIIVPKDQHKTWFAKYFILLA